MRASENTIAGVSLLIMCMIASGAAAAMEQNGSLAASMSPPAFSFPSFLDEDRLPALQEAWRARESGSDASEQAPALQENEAMSAARAAMKRIGEATRQAPVVRQAAEELSRRFSAIGGPAATEDAASGVVVSTAIKENGDAEAAGPDAEEAAAVAADGTAEIGGPSPVTATSAIPEAEMRPQSARLDEVPPRATTRMVVKFPPLPVRAPEATATANATVQRPARQGASPSTSSRTAPVARPAGPPVVAGRRDVFPPYMRAFGWNDQP